MKTGEFLSIITLIISIIVFIKLGRKEVIYVSSDIDNRKYLVRDLPDKTEVANLLAMIRTRIIYLTEYLMLHKADKDYVDFKPYIKRLNDRIYHTLISESSPYSSYTSYSVNIGEQLVFCVRSKNDNGLHDLNLVMYVALHEISHIACPEDGHTFLFRRIFEFFAQTAIDRHLYNKIPFELDPAEYCGITITDSVV